MDGSRAVYRDFVAAWKAAARRCIESDGGISVLLLIAACVVCVYIAAMLYKLMVLYRGNPPTPKALMTMLKNKDSFGMEKGESSHDKSGTE